MLVKRLLAFVLLAIVLASCGPIETGTLPPEEAQPATQTPEVAPTPTDTPAPSPTPTDTPEPTLPPMEWLVQPPFVAYTEEIPNLIPAEIPEGFIATEHEPITAETPSGATIHMFAVSLERPIGGQVLDEDYVFVQIFAYDPPEGRADHFDLVGAENYTWDFVELDGHRIVRYHTGSEDGRIWISGPYLIVLHSGVDTSDVGPWVDTIASLFLAMFPPP
jgi:hypothetical protein